MQVQCARDGDPRPLWSLYILASHRGQGHFSAWLKAHPDRVIITFPECGLEALLCAKHHPHSCLALPHTLWPEYLVMQDAYQNHVAERTGVLLMDHLDEGLLVLERIGASELVQRAFVLHPLLQGDAELGGETWPRLVKQGDTGAHA